MRVKNLLIFYSGCILLLIKLIAPTLLKYYLLPYCFVYKLFRDYFLEHALMVWLPYLSSKILLTATNW